jgi:hypothetical protein
MGAYIGDETGKNTAVCETGQNPLPGKREYVETNPLEVSNPVQHFGAGRGDEFPFE